MTLKRSNVQKGPDGKLTVTPYTREMVDRRKDELRPPIRANEEARMHLEKKRKRKKKEEEKDK